MASRADVGGGPSGFTALFVRRPILAIVFTFGSLDQGIDLKRRVVEEFDAGEPVEQGVEDLTRALTSAHQQAEDHRQG